MYAGRDHEATMKKATTKKQAPKSRKPAAKTGKQGKRGSELTEKDLARVSGGIISPRDTATGRG